MRIVEAPEGGGYGDCGQGSQIYHAVPSMLAAAGLDCAQLTDKLVKQVKQTSRSKLKSTYVDEGDGGEVPAALRPAKVLVQRGREVLAVPLECRGGV